MKLIVGLGNPGMQYDKTRHNAGFLAADALAQRHAAGQIPKSRFNAVTLDAIIGTEKTLLMKPTTYMNLSGKAVGEAVRFFKLDPSEDLIVLVDDIALPVGHIRVRRRGGSGGHNGLSDIDRVLGGDDYVRVRIGVGSVPKMMNQADWVLSRFMSEESADLNAAITKAADAVECILDQGVVKAMNSFNEKLTKPESKPKPERDQPVSNNSDSSNNENQSAQQG
jgi:PTH1 family peptidyl-tRNA hydrolase